MRQLFELLLNLFPNGSQTPQTHAFESGEGHKLFFFLDIL